MRLTTATLNLYQGVIPLSRYSIHVLNEDENTENSFPPTMEVEVEVKTSGLADHFGLWPLRKMYSGLRQAHEHERKEAHILPSTQRL